MRTTKASVSNGFMMMSLEIQLGSEGDAVFRRTRSGDVFVEHRALEVQRVADVPAWVPIQANGPGLCLSARARGGETAGDRGLIDLQLVNTRGDLERAPMSGRGIEDRVGAEAGTRIRRRLASQHPRPRHLPGVVRHVVRDASAGDRRIRVDVLDP